MSLQSCLLLCYITTVHCVFCAAPARRGAAARARDGSVRPCARRRDSQIGVGRSRAQSFLSEH
eukprot:998269-Pleurochrysis_carterae.AAC.1